MRTLIIILIALIVVNVTYWGWSELYIHDGSFYIGALKGLVSSVLCGGVGFLIPVVNNLT